MQDFPFPVAVGPGTLPDGQSLDYLAMPQAMRTFAGPVLPEPEDVRELAGARAFLARLRAAARDWQPGRATVSLDLGALPIADRCLIDQVLGEGEVGVQVTREDGTLNIQESVFAGVWRQRGPGPADGPSSDLVEVGDLPAAVRLAARSGQQRVADAPAPGPGVINAPALLTEIEARVAESSARRGTGTHVINLSLLPFTPEDGVWLDRCLGRGTVTILSRGYGNCRITATALSGVWWVQYFNSQDALILNSIEITAVPDVARAAREDLQDSAERLAEVIDWIG